MRTVAPTLLAAALLVALTGCGSEAPAAAPVPTTAPSGAVPPSSPASSTSSAASAPRLAAPHTYTGTGSGVVGDTDFFSGGVVDFACPRCDGNVVVQTLGPGQAPLINTIGPYRGQHLIGTRGEATTGFQVMADADWVLRVGGMELIDSFPSGEAIGNGDQVVYLPQIPAAATVVHYGEDDFTVQVLADGASRPVEAVRGVGSVNRSVSLVTSTELTGGLIEVAADGPWTITPDA